MFGAAPAIADNFEANDALDAPIAVIDADRRPTELPVNTRDRFGGNGVDSKDEGAQSPIFTDSSGSE